MAFTRKTLYDRSGTLFLMLMALPLTATMNIDCNGKPFHCVNSTHFMICVDLGSGVSATLDNFVIPCPPPTVCQGNNRFECEFPTVSSQAPELFQNTDMSGLVTTLPSETVSIPFEELYNTLSTATPSRNEISTLSEVTTDSSVTDVFENKNIATFGSHANLETVSGGVTQAFTMQADISTPGPFNTETNSLGNDFQTLAKVTVIEASTNYDTTTTPANYLTTKRLEIDTNTPESTSSIVTASQSTKTSVQNEISNNTPEIKPTTSNYESKTSSLESIIQTGQTVTDIVSNDYSTQTYETTQTYVKLGINNKALDFNTTEPAIEITSEVLPSTETNNSNNNSLPDIQVSVTETNIKPSNTAGLDYIFTENIVNAQDGTIDLNNLTVNTESIFITETNTTEPVVTLEPILMSETPLNTIEINFMINLTTTTIPTTKPSVTSEPIVTNDLFLTTPLTINEANLLNNLIATTMPTTIAETKATETVVISETTVINEPLLIAETLFTTNEANLLKNLTATTMPTTIAETKATETVVISETIVTKEPLLTTSWTTNDANRMNNLTETTISGPIAETETTEPVVTSELLLVTKTPLTTNEVNLLNKLTATTTSATIAENKTTESVVTSEPIVTSEPLLTTSLSTNDASFMDNLTATTILASIAKKETTEQIATNELLLKTEAPLTRNEAIVFNNLTATTIPTTIAETNATETVVINQPLLTTSLTTNDTKFINNLTETTVSAPIAEIEITEPLVTSELFLITETPLTTNEVNNLTATTIPVTIDETKATETVVTSEPLLVWTTKEFIFKNNLTSTTMPISTAETKTTEPLLITKDPQLINTLTGTNVFISPAEIETTDPVVTTEPILTTETLLITKDTDLMFNSTATTVIIPEIKTTEQMLKTEPILATETMLKSKPLLNTIDKTFINNLTVTTMPSSTAETEINAPMVTSEFLATASLSITKDPQLINNLTETVVVDTEVSTSIPGIETSEPVMTTESLLTTTSVSTSIAEIATSEPVIIETVRTTEQVTTTKVSQPMKNVTGATLSKTQSLLTTNDTTSSKVENNTTYRTSISTEPSVVVIKSTIGQYEITTTADNIAYESDSLFVNNNDVTGKQLSNAEYIESSTMEPKVLDVDTKVPNVGSSNFGLETLLAVDVTTAIPSVVTSPTSNLVESKIKTLSNDITTKTTEHLPLTDIYEDTKKPEITPQTKTVNPQNVMEPLKNDSALFVKGNITLLDQQITQQEAMKIFTTMSLQKITEIPFDSGIVTKELTTETIKQVEANKIGLSNTPTVKLDNISNINNNAINTIQKENSTTPKVNDTALFQTEITTPAIQSVQESQIQNSDMLTTVYTTATSFQSFDTPKKIELLTSADHQRTLSVSNISDIPTITIATPSADEIHTKEPLLSTMPAYNPTFTNSEPLISSNTPLKASKENVNNFESNDTFMVNFGNQQIATAQPAKTRSTTDKVKQDAKTKPAQDYHSSNLDSVAPLINSDIILQTKTEPYKSLTGTEEEEEEYQNQNVKNKLETINVSTAETTPMKNTVSKIPTVKRDERTYKTLTQPNSNVDSASHFANDQGNNKETKILNSNQFSGNENVESETTIRTNSLSDSNFSTDKLHKPISVSASSSNNSPILTIDLEEVLKNEIDIVNNTNNPMDTMQSSVVPPKHQVGTMKPVTQDNIMKNEENLIKKLSPTTSISGQDMSSKNLTKSNTTVNEPPKINPNVLSKYPEKHEKDKGENIAKALPNVRIETEAAHVNRIDQKMVLPLPEVEQPTSIKASSKIPYALEEEVTVRNSINSVTQSAITTSTARPVVNKFLCKPNIRGRFADSHDCRKFYICIGRVLPMMEGICPLNTVFSEIRKQCTKNLSHCVRNNQFQCVSEGRFSDFLNDNFYYICVRNKLSPFIRFKLRCQNGYHLNKTSVRCVLNTETSQSTSSEKSISDQSRSQKIKRKKPSGDFQCEKEGKFADPDDCRTYYECKVRNDSEFKRKKKKCDSDEYFHSDKKRCVDADSYECNS